MPPLPRGARLRDRYSVLKAIGRGGFAFVYLCEHLRTGNLVAVKEACPQFGRRLGDGSLMHADPMVILCRESLIAETVALGRARHENVVKLSDAFEANGTFYFAMPYVPGETLSHMVERRGKLSIASALRITEALLDAVQHLHDADVMHGDVKPQNLIVRPNGAAPLLIDLGTSLRLSDLAYPRPIITPGYSPPERYRAGGSLGPWSDVYSCAALLWKATTGKDPPDCQFDDQSQRASRDVRALPAHPDRDRLADALARSLAFESATRTASVAAFRAALGLKPSTSALPASGAPSVFISYAREDANIVYPLVRTLQLKGVNVWIDREGIAPGKAWAGEILKGIRSARHVLVFCSENSMRSENVRREVYLADQERRPIVAAMLENTKFHDDISLFLGPAQQLDVRQRDAGRLVSDVRQLLGYD